MNIRDLHTLSDDELITTLREYKLLTTELEVYLAECFLRVKDQRDFLKQAVIEATDSLNNSPYNFNQPKR